MKTKPWIHLLFLAIWVFAIDAMVARKKFKFTGKNKYSFFTKFAIGADNGGKFRVRGRLINAFNNPGDQFKVDVLFYEDDNWEHVLKTDECTYKRQFRNFKSEILITGDGNWSPFYGQWTLAKGRTRLWYVSAADCEGFTHLHYPSMPRIELEVEVLNGDSHFSQEDYGTLTFYWLIFFLLIGLFGKAIRDFYTEFKRENTYENPILILMIGVLSDLG